MEAAINRNYKKAVIQLIVFATILKCVLACTIEFGNDEVYYWTYTLHLQLSYFDHPPLVAFFIRVFTLNLKLHSELFIRLTAIIGSAVNTWLIFKILSRVKNDQAGWYAALLYTGCIYTTFISGFLILPDSPQVVFWLISIYLLIKIFILKEQLTKNLLLFGIFAGITTMCKIHGIYLWFAAALFILFFDRKQLQNPYLYLSGIITLIIISPIFIWNYQNAFITYTYQGGRVAINNSINLNSFSREIIGELLYCNPVIFILLFITLATTVRKHVYTTTKELFWLLMFLSLPLIFILWSVSLFRDTLPHWSGPAYIALLIFTAFYAPECFKQKTIKMVLRSANYLVLTLLIITSFFINYLPANLGKKDAQNLGANDFTLDMYGWNDFKNEFEKLRAKDIETHKMSANAIIISNKWFPASHFDYYVAYPLHMKLYAFGPMFDVHNFAWLNKQNGPIQKGADAYYISPSNYGSVPDSSYTKHFSLIDSAIIIHQYRSDVAVRNFYVYRMKSFR